MKNIFSLVRSVPLTFCIVLCTLPFFAYALPPQGGNTGTALTKEAFLKKTENLAKIFDLIENDYLYPVDWEKCFDTMAKSLSGGALYEENTAKDKEGEPKKFVCLDKHSRYLTAEETKSFVIQSTGHLSGIGVSLSQKENEIIVEEVFAKGPANGLLRTGDVIVGSRNIGETVMTPVENIKNAVERLRGKPGTVVHVTVKRNGAAMEFQITRGDVKIDSVFSRKLSSGIGYVRMLQFGSETADDFETQVGALRRKGVQSLVIDLRFNPGGQLFSALEMLYYFSPEPKIDKMLTARFRTREVVHTVKCPFSFEVFGKEIICGGFEYLQTGKEKSPGTMSNLDGVVVLVNGYSASASEIFAGTLQDWARTKGAKVKIVGETSYGKCVGQSAHVFEDGSSFIFTTFEFLVGNSKASVCGGVEPDYVVPVPDDFEFPIKVENINVEKDPQLKKAIELLMPVVPVPQQKPTTGT